MNKEIITDIFFDLDHTLWDFDKNSEMAFARVFSKHNIDINISEFIKIYDPINFSYWKNYREEKITKLELRRGRLIDTFKVLGLGFEISKIDHLSVTYIEEMPKDNHLFDGTIDILNYLERNYVLHIITNGFHEVQHLKLENSGIMKYFKTVITSEEVGVKKPNPLIFHAALDKAEVHATNSLMIGDTFEADILGAESVGMNTLLYNYRNERVSDKYKVVDSLIEIKNHL